MSEWEEKLPPLVREKLARIGEAAPQEKEMMKDSELLNSLLSRFYKGELDSDGLWRELKAFTDKGKGYLVKEAQMKLLDSLSLGSTAEEVQKRRGGLLATESLKEVPNTSALENGLNSLENVSRKYREEMQQAYNALRAQVERNPQLRLQQVKQGQTTMVIQLSVDEAVKLSAEWKGFVTNHEKRYTQEFARAIERLKKALR